MNLRIDETIEKTDILIDELIHNSNIIYSVHLDNLIKNKNIISAFHERNRKKLYDIALPFHTELLSENLHYSNMHFHLPNGYSFLRMHKPKEFGDNLRVIRPIIMQVHDKKNSVVGYEIGKHGLFYRVAKPVFFEGEYIGALEIGIKAKEVVDNLERVLDIKVARVIPESLLNDAFRQYGKNEIHIEKASVNPYDNKALFKYLLRSYNFGSTKRQIIAFKDIDLAVFSSGHLNNFQNDSIGSFIVAKDISLDLENYKTFLLRSLFLTLILIICAYFVLNLSFGKYINKIIELNTTLENKVIDRTKDLKQTTDQLQLANTELNLIFNTAADGMRVIDKNYRTIKVNDTFANLFSNPKEEIQNQACYECLKGEFCFTDQCTLKRIINGEEYIEIDVEKEIEPGIKRSFLLTAVPLKSLDGEILGVVENFKDITDRKKIFKQLEENEQYLNAIMSTVQAGVIITDGKNPTIIDANPYALKLIGKSKKELRNSNIREHFNLEKPWIDRVMGTDGKFEKEDYILTRSNGEKLNIRLSVAKTRINGESYLVQSFSDMSDIRRLIDKQLVDINKAKSIMDVINRVAPRFKSMGLQRHLFTEIINIPCNAEGGDHLFVQHFDTNSTPKTAISLKDQSGHEVNCILRSIYTDLLHNAANFNNPDITLDQVITRLNHDLCESEFFDDDDFFTSINAEIDHHSLMLNYISSGHPPILLIRNNVAQFIPKKKNGNTHLPIPFLKDAQYQATQFQLKDHDQLIFYTDGLTEMPIQNKGYILDQDKVLDIIQSILNSEYKKREGTISVSCLMKQVLSHIALLSEETVVPKIPGRSAVNSSSDDVTLIGIEIETDDDAIVKTLYPQKTRDITTFIRKFIDELFSDETTQPFFQLKNRIAMVLEEGLVNAWRHGNKKDTKKPITVIFRQRNDFVFEIIDQGNGFDFKSRPDPTLNKNIEKQSGRGLFIIEHFVDQIHWQKNGCHIVICMKKNEDLDDRHLSKKSRFETHLWEKTS